MLLGREVVVEPFVKNSDWAYHLLRERNSKFRRSHPLGQGAVCWEKGTFDFRCFVAQWRFDRTSRRKSKSKTHWCFKAR